MDNLFVNLEKYRGNEKRNPHEEFFTQLVAYVIKSDDELKTEFINFLVQDTAYKGSDFKNVSIKPEYWEKGVGESGREFDIKIEHENDLIIIVENKMGAREGKSKTTKEKEEDLSEEEIEEEKKQLDIYADWLAKQREYKYKILVLITHPLDNLYIQIEKRLMTQNKEVKDKQIEFKHVSWTQFHYFVNNYFKNKSKNNSDFCEGKNGFLINELIDYMEDENMGSWKPITKENDNRLKELFHVYNNFNKILADISIVFINLLDKDLKNSSKNDSIIANRIPSIFKEIEINDILLTFGFNASDDKESFSFIIELESKNGDSIKKIKNKLEDKDYKIDYYIEEKSDIISIILPLTDAFFQNDYLKQKKNLEDFSRKVLDDLIKIGI